MNVDLQELMAVQVLQRSYEDLNAHDITTALQAANVPGTTVTTIHDPDGAVVEACCIEVYVLLDPQRHALSVHCCHPHNADPYKTLTAPTLNDAITLVTTEFGHQP